MAAQTIPGPAVDETVPGLGRLADLGVRVRALGRVDALRETSAGSTVDGTGGTVHVYGQRALVGPLAGPDVAAPGCQLCLRRRWQTVRPHELRDALELGGGAQRAGTAWCNPFAVDTLAALVPLARQRVASGAGPSSRYSRVLEVDLEGLTVTRHGLVADSECPACSRPVLDDAHLARLDLASVPKPDPGASRWRRTRDLGIEIGAFANPVCGALGPSLVLDLASRTTSATVGCFTLRSGEYLRETFWGGHADTYDDSAHIGVLEGLERAAGMRSRHKVPTVVASLDSVSGQAVDPRECGLYDEQFYRANPSVLPFSPDREIRWVWGWSLRDSRAVLVPEVLTYYHVPGLAHRFVQESSNGCASGSCLEEAVTFGLLEVVERDAFLLAWYGRTPLPEIDPDTSARAETRLMVDRLAMEGYRARFFDARVTFDIPVVVAVAQRTTPGLGALCFGAGASLDPEAALGAALCEIATDAPNAEGRTRVAEQRLRAMSLDFDRVLALHDHPLLYGLPEMAHHADFLLRDRPAPVPLAERFARVRPAPAPGDDLLDDLTTCVAAVTEAGFDVVVVDQTLPEQRTLGLRTCSVLVPGVLPIDFGWRRQRARTMTRTRTARWAAGLADAPLDPAALNSAPHPFP